MPDLLRDELIKTSDVIVVKVGTNVLSLPNGLLNVKRIEQLTEELNQLILSGKKVILVSSGAVGAGMGRLGLKERPNVVPQLQAVAAIGQSRLIEAYEAALGRFGIHAGQVLLTADDLSHRRRYLNARNALRAMLDYGALPIINENDTVSVRELETTFGDNDRLAALVAGLFDNPLLILLTDVDGLFDRDPSEEGAELISVVDTWTPELMSFVVEKNSQRSRGGMSSKLKAAKIMTEAGGCMIIANGDVPNILEQIFSAKEVGTVFIAQDQRLRARKRWIGYAGRPTGTLVVDEGAVRALLDQGKSLLPVGVISSRGHFEKGDLVSITNANGQEVARGLSNYNDAEMLLIRKKSTKEIADILGHLPYVEAVHRDNMQILS
ncbi:MAG: glutamate 5-kinase [Thermoguttaceae bacterium]